MNTTGKVLTGILAGAAAGAILGILFAPNKGSKTRQDIKDAATDFKDSVSGKVNDFVGAISDKFSRLKNEATDAIENGKEKVATAKAEAKHALS